MNDANVWSGRLDSMLDIIAGIEDFRRRKGLARARDLTGALNLAERQSKVDVS